MAPFDMRQYQRFAPETIANSAPRTYPTFFYLPQGPYLLSDYPLTFVLGPLSLRLDL
jgi:hypothetical protein